MVLMSRCASGSAHTFLITSSSSMSVRTDLSPTALMRYCVPQGSALGPILYCSCYRLPTLSSWLSPVVCLCICMLMSLQYTASVWCQQLTCYRCICQPVSKTSTGCHQIGCSLTPTRQRCYGAHQPGDRINCLLHYSECVVIALHTPDTSTGTSCEHLCL